MFPIETSWVIRGQAHLGKKIWQMNQVPRANALIKWSFPHSLHRVATKEDIDDGMKHSTNHPMGPLELADLIEEVNAVYALFFVPFVSW